MLIRGLLITLTAFYHFVASGVAGITGLEYLQPGPNFVRVCCNVVSVSASELVFSTQTNTTSTVPVFTDAPVYGLLLNTVRLTRENMPSMNASTIALGPDSKLETGKMYLVCVTTVTSSIKRCFTFRPCDCATCATTKPWLMFNISNVAAADPNSIQLYTAPIFADGRPTVPISLRLRVWDGMLYRSCLSYPNAAILDPESGCGIMTVHMEAAGAPQSYFDDTVISPSGSATNLTKSFTVRDDNALSTVSAGLNVTLMLSLLGASYEDGVIEVPNKAWNRNGFSTYSQIVPYATPSQTNGYQNPTETADDLAGLCQQVQARRAADSVVTTTTTGVTAVGAATTARNIVAPAPPPAATNAPTGPVAGATTRSSGPAVTVPPSGSSGSGQVTIRPVGALTSNPVQGSTARAAVSFNDQTVGTAMTAAAAGNGAPATAAATAAPTTTKSGVARISATITVWATVAFMGIQLANYD